MRNGQFRVFAGLAIVALVISALVVPAGASSRTQAQGVDQDSVQIIDIVPDIDKLIARGIQLSGQSTQSFFERALAHKDAYGKLAGREAELLKVAYDPQDSTSFDRACTESTIDNQPFVVMSAAGIRDSAIACFTVDNATPFFTSDPMPTTLFKGSKKNLLSLALPSDVAGKEGAALLVKSGTLPKTAKVGILSNNIPGVKAAGDAVEKELEKRGIEVVSKIEMNGLASDANILTREATAAPATYQASGADAIINVNSFTQVIPFFAEAARLNYKPQMYGIDGQANACTKDGGGRLPAGAAGVICITTNDYLSEVDGASIRQDTAFEAECRARHEAIKGYKTTPNMPGGGRTVGTTKYEEDYSPFECMIMEILLPAIKKAGKNPTWAKVHANILNTTKAPAAYMSNGEGGFGPNKPYFANAIHAMKLNIVDATTPKAANGTYNGCPSPVTCWVPMNLGNKEWYPISTAS